MKRKPASACVLLLAATVFAAEPSRAETVNVSSVTELTNALVRLNREENSAHTVILAKGFYDVSECVMHTKAHLSVSYLTLKGETTNPRDTVIYGNKTGRILYCTGGTVAHLTVSNGYHATESGAGISAEATIRSTITNLVVTCCEAPYSEGGAVSVVTYVRGCLMENNYGKYGGGVGQIPINSFKDSGVYGGTIRGNSVSYGGGGAMNVSLYGVRIENNRCLTNGGGVFINTGQSIHGCTVVSNTAGCYGGGVYFSTSNGSSLLTNSLVACNSAGEGGGGCALYNKNWAIDCTISNNVCSGTHPEASDICGGGGVFYGNLRKCTVIGNSVTNFSLAISPDSSGARETAYKRHSQGGGALGCSLIEGCTIVGNFTVNRGGGIADSVFSNCIISNNTACCYGGGIHDCSGTDSDIVFNMCKNDRNSNLKNYTCGAGASESFVTNSLIAGNAAVLALYSVDSRGGGGYETEFHNCEIKDNYSTISAAMQGGSAVKSTFKNNATATGGTVFRSTKGFTDCDIQGAVFDWPGHLTRCRVHGYDPDGYAEIASGANVYTSGVFKTTTTGNYSPTLLGAGTSVQAKTSMAATNTIFYGNTVRTMFWPAELQASFVNCQIVSNRIGFTCVGVSMSSGDSIEFVNTIIAGNRNQAGTSACEYSPESKSDTNVVARSCIFGTGSKSSLPRIMENCLLDVNMRFKNDGEWPFQSVRTSPAAGNGLVQEWMTGSTDIRGEGYPRLRDGKVDIGCYQYHRNYRGMDIFVR